MMTKLMMGSFSSKSPTFFQSFSRAYSNLAYRVRLMEKNGDRIGVISSKENDVEKLAQLKKELAAKDYEVYSVRPDEIMVVQSKDKFLKDINEAAQVVEDNTSKFTP